MKEKDFEKLVESVKQAGRIKRGEARPTDVIRLRPLEIREIRSRSPSTKLRTNGEKS